MQRNQKSQRKNFKEWQHKDVLLTHHIWFIVRFLKETVPQVEPLTEDPLYNVYCKTTTAKELWESLERKYKTEDAGTKKFVVAQFLDYKMVDSKNVISQVEHAGSSSRSNPKGKGKNKRKNDKKSKGKSEYLAPKAGIMKQKFQGTCYNCYQPSHRAANYKMPKRTCDVSDKSKFHSSRAVTMNRKDIMAIFATAVYNGEGDVNTCLSYAALFAATWNTDTSSLLPYSPQQNVLPKGIMYHEGKVTAMLISPGIEPDTVGDPFLKIAQGKSSKTMYNGKSLDISFDDITRYTTTLDRSYLKLTMRPQKIHREDNKLDQKDTYAPESAKANMVEHAGSSLRSNPKGKGKDKRKNDKKSKGKSEYLSLKLEHCDN
ncbi:hypothetical protein Tco_0023997 [Tanacetum coccineum]